jgi:hypothetical protein
MKKRVEHRPGWSEVDLNFRDPSSAAVLSCRPEFGRFDRSDRARYENLRKVVNRRVGLHYELLEALSTPSMVASGRPDFSFRAYQKAHTSSR